jgi:beta-galactosidase
MVFIANYWNDSTYKDVKIYSNCSEIELFLNGKLLARQKPDTGRISNNLKHPPFTFRVSRFEPGTLFAKGYINNQKVVETSVSTPGLPAKMKLTPDISGKELKAGCNDVIFVYASIIDNKGVVVPNDNRKVVFKIESGDATIIGPGQIEAEAGIATILLKAGNKAGNIKLSAKADGLEETTIQLISK